MMKKIREVELLAPARTADIAIEAIRHGADAVYIGPASHGARAAAGNSIDDIRRAVEYAHRFNARVYATVNTIVYDNELREVERLIRQLYEAGVDALIVQDMAVLTMDIPPIALHASTQCDIRTPQRARFLQDVGFSQLVLPRELTPGQIQEYAQAVSVPLEVFVHGALCVSYSGDCHASCLTTGRSANRGQCAQICRLPYTVTDAEGSVLASNTHALSLRDMCRIDQLGLLLDSGATSFKIEGRLKDANYVKTVTAAYSQALDRAIAERPGLYRRRGRGTVELGFTPDVTDVFNRGLTPYFFQRARTAPAVSSMQSPKWVGKEIGTVGTVTKKWFTLQGNTAIGNGDGLGFYAPNGQFVGFRANKAEGDRIFPFGGVSADLQPGTTIYRNRDVQRDKQMEGATATRIIDIDARLWPTADGRLSLEVSDDYGTRGAYAIEAPQLQTAQTPQHATRLRTISKTGQPELRLRGLDDTAVADLFIPAALLTQLRRGAIEAYCTARHAAYRYEYRAKGNPEAKWNEGAHLTYHANVANEAARQFYLSRGAKSVQMAQEVSPTKGETVVMTTKFCPLHDLGLCLRTPRGAKIKTPVYLQGQGAMRLKLTTDCNTCTVRLTVGG